MHLRERRLTDLSLQTPWTCSSHLVLLSGVRVLNRNPPSDPPMEYGLLLCPDKELLCPDKLPLESMDMPLRCMQRDQVKNRKTGMVYKRVDACDREGNNDDCRCYLPGTASFEKVGSCDPVRRFGDMPYLRSSHQRLHSRFSNPQCGG